MKEPVYRCKNREAEKSFLSLLDKNPKVAESGIGSSIVGLLLCNSKTLEQKCS